MTQNLEKLNRRVAVRHITQTARSEHNQSLREEPYSPSRSHETTLTLDPTMITQWQSDQFRPLTRLNDNQSLHLEPYNQSRSHDITMTFVPGMIIK
jgi:hypothetical protein